jgi:hypothetical protein
MAETRPRKDSDQSASTLQVPGCYTITHSFALNDPFNQQSVDQHEPVLLDVRYEKSHEVKERGYVSFIRRCGSIVS